VHSEDDGKKVTKARGEDYGRTGRQIDMEGKEQAGIAG